MPVKKSLNNIATTTMILLIILSLFIDLLPMMAISDSPIYNGSISGVCTSGGNPLSGVTVSVTGGASATTDTNGGYTVSFTYAQGNEQVTVTASKNGYTNAQKSVNMPDIDQSSVTGVDLSLSVTVTPTPGTGGGGSSPEGSLGSGGIHNNTLLWIPTPTTNAASVGLIQGFGSTPTPRPTQGTKPASTHTSTNAAATNQPVAGGNANTIPGLGLIIPILFMITAALIIAGGILYVMRSTGKKKPKGPNDMTRDDLYGLVAGDSYKRRRRPGNDKYKRKE